MHAWLCENPVGVDALTWKELPTPAPKAGEVLIEIKAASLNFPDLLIVQNKYQMKPPLPFVPGSEYAGVVAAVGEGVTHVKPGDRVAYSDRPPGSYAELRNMPARPLVRLPRGIDFETAAAMMLKGMTVQYLFRRTYKLHKGQTILFHAAENGGIGKGKAVFHRLHAVLRPEEAIKLLFTSSHVTLDHLQVEWSRDDGKHLTFASWRQDTRTGAFAIFAGCYNESDPCIIQGGFRGHMPENVRWLDDAFGRPWNNWALDSAKIGCAHW